ncbi:hypothetical protein NL676_039428 [Syzygium grande]|nr:hypothetical protein NL676_039428 [Syzygium grande]
MSGGACSEESETGSNSGKSGTTRMPWRKPEFVSSQSVFSPVLRRRSEASAAAASENGSKNERDRLAGSLLWSAARHSPWRSRPASASTWMFDIWCLHIPALDRTSFLGLVKMVERAIKAETYRSPNRPIHLVGESLGGCLALAVTACNPDIDLLLILANPATSFDKSGIRHLLPLLEFMPILLRLSYPFNLSLMADIR